MDYLTSVQNLLKTTAKQPDKVFLNQPIDRQWHTFTWREVEHQARCIAAGLIAQGYKPQSRIGILSKNCAQWFIADLAITMAGMISVPIYATAGKKTISYIISHAELKAIFVGKLDSLIEAESAIDDNVLRISFPYPTISANTTWSKWLEQYAPLATLHQPDLNDISTIVYTSGTTGQPKGVEITHKNLASAAASTAIVLQAKASDRCMSYLPLAHITERSVIEHVCFYIGCEVFFVESLDTFIDDVQHAEPTLFLSVPRLWSKFQAQILAKIPQKKLTFLLSLPVVGRIVAYKIRKALGLHKADRFGSGTAPISIAVLSWFHSIGINIGEGWGMSETSGMSCGNTPFIKNNLGTIGRALSCVEMSLSDKNEILIRGDAVFKQYYLNEEATANAFVDGWFRTGDSGEIGHDGSFKIVGRLKEQFKTSKGKYIVPVPIECSLYANLNIEQVCVMGSGLKQPIALVILSDNCTRQDAELTQGLEDTLQQINDALESHQKLDYLLVCSEPWTIDNGFLTPTMKLKRNEIENKFQALVESELSGKVLWEETISNGK